MAKHSFKDWASLAAGKVKPNLPKLFVLKDGATIQ